MVIEKLLCDRRELDTLAGRITLGVVVLQDLVSNLLLSIQPNLNDLRAAEADYVNLPRIEEARDLVVAVRAAVDGLLVQKQAAIDLALKNRSEVLP